jgi:hypothetical protein
MVVEAVRLNRSPMPNSLLTAKITGNYSNLAILSDFSFAKPHALRRVRYRFPTQNNRENNYRIRENFAQKQGSFRNSGGGRAPSYRLQSPPKKWASMFPSCRSVSVGGPFRLPTCGLDACTVTFQRRFRFGRGTEGRASVWAHPNRMRSCEPLGDGRDGARHPRPGVRAVLRPRGIGKAGERLAPPKSLKLLAG